MLSKDIPLIAIELYDGPNGPAYTHLTNVLINGKLEMRVCDSTAKIDKSAYGKLPKTILSPGVSLEYGNDGILVLIKAGTSSCVVPSNLKYEKNSPATPAELASKAILQGKVLSSGADADSPPAPLKPGVVIVFVAEPDVELAEYLRAQRASTIPAWQDYLGKFPSNTHTPDAKDALARLFVKDGTASLETYRKSLSSETHSYDELKKARLRASQALIVLPSSAIAGKLDEDAKNELLALVNSGQKEIQSYKEALKAHTKGYEHLTSARSLAIAVFQVDPHFLPALSFQGDANSETEALESHLHSAETLVASKRIDDAFAAIRSYTAFADEVPRVAAIVNSTYEFHLAKGQELATAKDWNGAVKEFEKASEIRQTKESLDLLKDARTSLETATNKDAANAALKKSQALEAQQQYIGAFEVLFNLPPAQRALVVDDLQHLSPAYIQSASQSAKELQLAHDPIHGLRDELEIEKAYGYLRQAHELGSDPQMKDRMDDLADKLSDYYLQQAKRYMDKPLGTGAGLGWSYLDKALAYKASNLEAVRDERTRASSAYQMRSRLSIRVVFRDQTSRRDSAGFADQLADALATGLETSGLPVRVIRPGETPQFEPNFQFFGDVLQHRHASVPTSKPRDSKYRAGEQNVPNENWNKTNREYESATLDLQRAQGSLQGATVHGKKKEIAEANNQVTAAQKKVEEAHAKLDSIPTTVPVDIIKPYTYTEKDVALNAIVQLQFRIVDSANTQVESPATISQEDGKQFVVFENVKPEDTEGVKQQGTIPDDIQFLTDVENIARDKLLKAVRESVAKFPDKVFEQARKREESGELDGAAEAYILYLNSTSDLPNPKRDQAESFLADKYNIHRKLSSDTSK